MTFAFSLGKTKTACRRFLIKLFFRCSGRGSGADGIKWGLKVHHTWAAFIHHIALPEPSVVSFDKPLKLPDLHPEPEHHKQDYNAQDPSKPIIPHVPTVHVTAMIAVLTIFFVVCCHKNCLQFLPRA